MIKASDNAPPKLDVHSASVEVNGSGSHDLAIALIDAGAATASGVAWPIAAVIITLTFKHEVSQVLGRLRNLKVSGLEVSMDAFIQETLKPVVLPTPNSGRARGSSETVPDKMAYLPLDAIVTSWLRVETALNEALHLTFDQVSRTSVRSKLEMLKASENAPTRLKELVKSLHTIRSRLEKIASDKITQDSVRLYEENADQAVYELNRIKSA